MGEHPHQGVIEVVAHLSSMYALQCCACEALDEHEFPIGDADVHLRDVRRGLIFAADALMEPFGVANVLQTVEETIASASTEDGANRELVVRAILDTALAARQDDRDTLPEGRSRCKLCQSTDCGCVLGRPPSEWVGCTHILVPVEHALNAAYGLRTLAERHDFNIADERVLALAAALDAEARGERVEWPATDTQEGR